MNKSIKELSPAARRYLAGVRAHDPMLRHVAVVERVLETRRRNGLTGEWEMLPWVVQYYPMIRIHLRHLRKITALNPGMGGMGGLVGASKLGIFSHLSSAAVARTLYVPAGTATESLTAMMQQVHPQFPAQPVICKPDVGERSADVRKVYDRKQLMEYLNMTRRDFLVQEYIPGPEELGVSCFRSLQTGKLETVAVVRRRIAGTRGDGSRSLGALIEAAELAGDQKRKIRSCYTPEQLESVPAAGEWVLLSPVAALSYGTVIEEVPREHYSDGFRKLDALINAVCVDDRGREFSGFNYGRFDYRAASIEALFEGKGKILELNGAAAMALHACVPGLPVDTRYAIFDGFFQRMREICEENHRSGRGRYTPLPLLALKVRRRLHRSAVQWQDLHTSLKELRAAVRGLKKEIRGLSKILDSGSLSGETDLTAADNREPHRESDRKPTPHPAQELNEEREERAQRGGRDLPGHREAGSA